MNIAVDLSLNTATVCLGFATYDVELPDISLASFLDNF